MSVVTVIEKTQSHSENDQQIRLLTAQGHEVVGLTVAETAELLRLLS